MTDAMLSEVWQAGRQDTVVSVITSGETLPDGHPATGKGQGDGLATAYVCEGPVCSLPVTAAEPLATLLAPGG